VRDLLPSSVRLLHISTRQRSVYRAHDTVEILKKEAPDFIPPTLWPLNSPDLNSVDYKVWWVIQEQVYKHHVKDISELRKRIVDITVGQ